LNPLNWTAVPFLEFQLVITAICFAAIFALRSSLGPSKGDDRNINAIEAAYLAGGRRRAADAALIALLAAGEARIGAEARVYWSAKSTAPLPEELRSFRLHQDWSTRLGYHQAVPYAVDDVRLALSRRGLAPSQETMRRLQWDTIGIIAIPVVLGLAKAYLGGLVRGHPIGMIVELIVLTMVCGSLLLRHAPFRTRAGHAAIAKLRSVHSRAARAPLESELALAFAITGPAVLMGTPYAALGMSVSPGFGSNGGGGSCSGGGGCGGGCGGGGCGGCGG
jgi:uncharacterized protein (TIGR04222 family)